MEILPDRTQVGIAIATAFVLLVSCVWIAWFGETRLPPFPAFIPAIDATLLVSDLVTATLLFGHASVFRSRAYMALAAGYLYTALVAIVHALSFPGVFTPTGLFGSGSSSTAWIAIFWRAGFPLAICVYVRLKAKEQIRFIPPWAGIAVSIGAAAAVAMALSTLAIKGEDWLPPLSANPSEFNHSNLLAAVALVIVLSLAAFTMLMRQQKSRLDVWLLVALLGWVAHLLLVGSTSARFTVAWYFSFMVGTLSHVIVMLALIAEASRNHARLALSVSALRHEREGKLIAIEAVTAALANEIGQPLTAVSINALAGTNWLTRERPDIEMAIHALHATMEAGNRTSELIKSIRAASRKSPLKVTAFSLNTLVRETASSMHRQLVREKIELRLALEEGLPPIVADQAQMRWVLVNLFTNAIASLSATRDRPHRIAIRSRRLEGWQVRLEFSDNGIGIAPDALPHIFAPFSTTKAKGTGASLALCRTIVEERGGSFWTEQGDTRGATFFLQLPHSGWTEENDVEPYG